jgi:hypothetical protein
MFLGGISSISRTKTAAKTIMICFTTSDESEARLARYGWAI